MFKNRRRIINVTAKNLNFIRTKPFLVSSSLKYSNTYTSHIPKNYLSAYTTVPAKSYNHKIPFKGKVFTGPKAKAFYANYLLKIAIALPIMGFAVYKQKFLHTEPQAHSKQEEFFNAIINGEIALVKKLIGEGVSLIAASKYYGKNALQLAASQGHFDIVKYLVEECNADIKTQDSNGANSFALAAIPGNIEIMQYLMNKNASVIRQKDRALHSAARSGHTTVVKWLLATVKADIASCDNEGNTSLLLAASAGHSSTAQWLLEEGGAKYDEYNKIGKYVLMIAIKKGDYAFIEWLVGKYKNQGILKQYDNNWKTALHYAAKRGDLKIVKFLVNAGADVHAQTNSSYGDGMEIPLLTACKNGHLDVVRFLFSRTTQGYTCKTYKNNDTPLLLAARYGKTHVVAWLLDQRQGSIDEKNYYGNTPLMLAIQRGRVETVKLLLENNASLTLQNDNKKTAENLMHEHADLATKEEMLTILRDIKASRAKQNEVILSSPCEPRVPWKFLFFDQPKQNQANERTKENEENFAAVKRPH